MSILSREDAERARLIIRYNIDKLDAEATKYGIVITKDEKKFIIRKLSRLPKAGLTQEHVVARIRERTHQLFDLLVAKRK